MIKTKQIKDFTVLKNLALVSATQQDNGTVILTRNDGFSLSFVADINTAHEKGDIGEEGEQGDPGLTAYEIAILEGYQGTKEEWLQSLKGEKGEQGDKGLKGKDGINYEDPILNGLDISYSLHNQADISNKRIMISVKNDTKGDIGNTGESPTIEQCVISQGDFSARVDWQSSKGTLVLQIPSIPEGEPGVDGTATDGTSPTLTTVTLDNVKEAGSSFSCEGGGSGSVGYIFTLAAAASGLQGEEGEQGLQGSVIGKTSAVLTSNILRPDSNLISFNLQCSDTFKGWYMVLQRENGYAILGDDIADIKDRNYKHGYEHNGMIQGKSSRDFLSTLKRYKEVET